MRGVLLFFPERQCSECGRMTTVALVTNALQQSFLPLCPWHGLVEPTREHPSRAERRREETSIARFVQAIHQGYGCVRVKREVSPKCVPGWKPPQKSDLTRHHFPDRAWEVEIKRGNKRVRRGWVLWSYVEMCFSWVRETVRGSRR